MDLDKTLVTWTLGSNKGILEDHYPIIVQQNNTKQPYNGGGLAGKIYKTFKEIQDLHTTQPIIQAKEQRIRLYGKCKIIRVNTDKSEEEKRFVVNVFGQYSCGGLGSGDNSAESRMDKFKLALDNLAEQLDEETYRDIRFIARRDGIAFPVGIGCGISGGDWNDYYKMIWDFAQFYKYPVKMVTQGKHNTEGKTTAAKEPGMTLTGC